MYKVAIVQPILSPNRIPIFETLCNQEEYKIKLFILCKSLPERPGWDYENKYMFESTNIKTYSFKFSNNKKNDLTEPYRIPLGLSRALFEYKPDLILVSNATEALFSHLYCLISNAKLGIIVADLDFIHRKKNFFKRKFKEFIYKKMSLYFAYGDNTVKFLKSIGINDNIYKTYWSVDNNLYRHNVNQGDVDLFDKFQGKIIFLTVGQLIPRKGIMELLNAWELLDDKIKLNCILIIIGSGYLDNELKNRSSKIINANIIFIPHLDRKELSKYYKKSNIFIFPTLEDVWGLVVNEAMAAGLPILCSKYAGCSDELIQSGENGFVFDPLDKESILNSINKIFFLKNQLKDLGEKSIKIINNYTLDVTADQIHKGIIKYMSNESR